MLRYLLLSPEDQVYFNSTRIARMKLLFSICFISCPFYLVFLSICLSLCFCNQKRTKHRYHPTREPMNYARRMHWAKLMRLIQFRIKNGQIIHLPWQHSPVHVRPPASHARMAKFAPCALGPKLKRKSFETLAPENCVRNVHHSFEVEWLCGKFGHRTAPAMALAMANGECACVWLLEFMEFCHAPDKANGQYIALSQTKFRGSLISSPRSYTYAHTHTHTTLLVLTSD